MTGRERILRALDRKETDYIPWTPCVEGYYLSGLDKPSNQVDAVREIGGDVFARHIPTYRAAMAKDPSAPPRPETGDDRLRLWEMGMDGLTDDSFFLGNSNNALRGFSLPQDVLDSVGESKN